MTGTGRPPRFGRGNARSVPVSARESGPQLEIDISGHIAPFQSSLQRDHIGEAPQSSVVQVRSCCRSRAKPTGPHSRCRVVENNVLSAVVGSAIQERSGEGRRPCEICLFFYLQTGDRVELKKFGK
jgi:hypothetical protein